MDVVALESGYRSCAPGRNQGGQLAPLRQTGRCGFSGAVPPRPSSHGPSFCGSFPGSGTGSSARQPLPVPRRCSADTCQDSARCATSRPAGGMSARTVHSPDSSRSHSRFGRILQGQLGRNGPHPADGRYSSLSAPKAPTMPDFSKTPAVSA